MAPLETIDVLLRGASLGLLALVIIRFLSVRSIAFFDYAFAALAGAMALYVLGSAPVTAMLFAPLGVWFPYLPVVTPFLFWWAGLALFDDDFHPRPWHVLPALLVTLPVFFLNTVPWVWLFRSFVVLGLYLHLIWVVRATGPGDLVDMRRRFRRWFVLASVLFGLVIAGVEMASRAGYLPGRIYVIHSGAILILTLAFTLWALDLHPSIRPAPGAKPKPDEPPRDTAADARIRARLEAAMTKGLWQQEGLSIGGLAEALDVPEHQLRRFINQRLGHRNFAAFINGHRIAAACKLLHDPERAGDPILSLAFEVGFSSLGPFNRAFRQQTGQSPTEFRRNIQKP